MFPGPRNWVDLKIRGKGKEDKKLKNRKAGKTEKG